MSSSLSGTKIAILIANGFNEIQMTAFQRAFQGMGANITLVSNESGLVHGWAGNEWGHHHMVGAPLNQVLAVDFDYLLVPGGEKGAENLSQTLHTKRFIGGFVNEGKPCAVLDDAVALLLSTGLAAGKEVGGSDAVKGEAALQDATYIADDFVVDGALMTTGVIDDVDGLVSSVIVHFENQSETQMAA